MSGVNPAGVLHLRLLGSVSHSMLSGFETFSLSHLQRRTGWLKIGNPWMRWALHFIRYEARLLFLGRKTTQTHLEEHPIEHPPAWNRAGRVAPYEMIFQLHYCSERAEVRLSIFVASYFCALGTPCWYAERSLRAELDLRRPNMKLLIVKLFLFDVDSAARWPAVIGPGSDLAPPTGPICPFLIWG